MVKTREPSEYDKLEALVHDLATRHGMKIDVTGWTRKTYDLYVEKTRLSGREILARVESLATSNGEIRVFDARADAFALELGTALEQTFGLPEAVVLHERRSTGPN